MSEALYDAIDDYYAEFVQRNLKQPSCQTISAATILELVGSINGRSVCDLACGEGHLSRLLASRGAAVTGIDLSKKLLVHARRQAAEAKLDITFKHGDAQTLPHIANNSFDIVVCNMALMDIPDLAATFQTVQRILKPTGTFIFAVLHPCFETPFTVPDDIVERDDKGNFTAVRVMRYTEEGHWNSGGTGMRGRVGAHHRMLSTYVNTLLTNGFQLQQLAEPTFTSDEQSLWVQWGRAIPRVLLVKSIKTG